MAHRDGRLDEWHTAALSLLPEGSPVWDGHTHTGVRDPDGVAGTPQSLLEKLSVAGHAGAAVMTNQDPDGYRVANDRGNPGAWTAAEGGWDTPSSSNEKAAQAPFSRAS